MNISTNISWTVYSFLLTVVSMSIMSGCASLSENSQKTLTTLSAHASDSGTHRSTVSMISEPEPRLDFTRIPSGQTLASDDAMDDDGATGGRRSWCEDGSVCLANAAIEDVSAESESEDRLEHDFDVASSDVIQYPPVDDVSHTFTDLLHTQWKGIRSDHAEFYSPRGLMWLAAGLGAGSLMANTGFDERLVRDTYLENVVFAPSHEYYERFHQPKVFGDGYYTIPAFALAALAEPLIDELPFGPETAEWGQRSLRTILVGGPPMLGLQLLTGGSRPGETSSDSRWKPFQDNNGVSGHSFMGAIPFMSAAKITDNVWLKSGLYAASALPALSRVNDDNHYFSQAFLGWWLAYVAASAVDRSYNPDASYQFFAYPQRDGFGVGLDVKY